MVRPYDSLHSNLTNAANAESIDRAAHVSSPWSGEEFTVKREGASATSKIFCGLRRASIPQMGKPPEADLSGRRLPSGY